MSNGKIKEVFSAPDLESYGGYKYSSDLTPFENLNEILNDLNEELENLKESIKENPNSLRTMVIKANMRRVRAVIRKINDVKYKLKNQMLYNILKEFDVHVSSKLNYLQTLVFLLIYSKLIGFNKINIYEYCVIDEGQDFSLLEFAVLNSFVLRGRFGIFGDLNQGIFSDGIKDWDEIKEVIPEAKTANVFKLETNYRNTKPIIDLANNILNKYTKDYLPKSVNRKGPEPEIIVHATTNELVKEFDKHLSNDTKNLSKSIGIVCYDQDLMQKAATILDSKKIVYTKLDQTLRINYTPNGVYLMSVDDCKGLEFSKVFILGLNTSKIKEVGSARKAFVAVTRAMNELVILGT